MEAELADKPYFSGNNFGFMETTALVFFTF
jgi:hypothetical protein